MDVAADGQAPAAAEAAVGEIRPQERSMVRRRMVQSTLVPHKSPAVESKVEQKNDGNCNGEDKDGGEDECCSSQGNKKRTRKRKESPQTKTPRASKKAIQASPEVKSGNDATPEKTTPKSAAKMNGTPRTPKRNTTPKKNGRNGKISQLVENGDALPQIPNLRLEAKLMAEENSRVFGGKQIHPFFLMKNASCRSGDKANQKKAKGATIGPIHVFDREQDDYVPLDWRNLKFADEPFPNSGCVHKSAFSSIFELTVKPLKFDKFRNLLHCSGISLEDNVTPDNCQQESFQTSATAVSSNAVVECCKLVVDAKSENQANEPDPGIVRKSDEQDEQAEILQERFMSSQLASSSQFGNKLWTEKYQPGKAAEICGNDDSVKVLSEWLQTWSQRGHKANRDLSGCNPQDPDYDCFQCDSDSENINEETSIKNVLLITGPAGSGKSAAVYACAKEQGFRVLEASASECRNGAALRDRFGVLESQATLDSQLFQWSQESSIEFQSTDVTNSDGALSNGTIPPLGSEVNNAILIPDEDASSGAAGTNEKPVFKDNTVACGLGQLKPLLLFEDVDIVFPEDRGFVTAIQQIADSVKWPVILTCNSDKPLLPNSLDRLEVCFKLPSEKELFQLIHTVCTAEKVNVEPHLGEQLIEYCEKDIRKTITHLQFWCQSKRFRKGKVKRLSTEQSFDLEAGHQVLPKMIPWSFPSQLAELVEKEISTTLSMMEENSFFDAVKEDKPDDETVQENSNKRANDTDIIKAKKKAMLRKHCSENDCVDFVGLYDPPCDLLDLSSSPVPYSGKSGRRKLVVMSSDSEDESTPDKNAVNQLSVEINGGYSLQDPCGQRFLSPSTDLVLCSGVEKLEENPYKSSQAAPSSLEKSSNPFTDLRLCSRSDKLDSNHQFPEMTIDLNVKDTSVDVDVSCVPESSFVPETIINDRTKELFGRISSRRAGQEDENAEEASVSNEFRQNPFPPEVDDFDEPTTEFCRDHDSVWGTFDLNSTLGFKDTEDSLYEIGEPIKGPQLMDECSCIDFSRKFKKQIESKPSTAIDTVQNSWRRLRNERADLKQLVASEDKSFFETMNLTFEMSHLISEVELLRAQCQSLDTLELAFLSSEESNSFGWCDEQLQMTSAVLQHGFCLYAKDIASVGLNIGSDVRENRDGNEPIIGLLEKTSETESRFANIVRSMVPPRAHMSIKGYTMCEYLSSLGQISRSESSRLSDCIDNTKRRRGRAARNYLSNGSLILSAEEISLLGKSNIYGSTDKK